MNYSSFQKIVSSLLLFIFFFGQITGLSIFSIFSSTYAQNKDFSSLVSIIVSEDFYDKLDDKIERYALDIQNTLENTRAIIIPVKKDTNPFQIASINESLFNEGYNSLEEVNFESRLVWTVLIWKLPLASISKNAIRTKSVFPFVDFLDKWYIYDHDSKTFEKNRENLNWLKAEIWHWVISPNTWDSELDIEKVGDFLDKTHDFYNWKNNFDVTKNILNAKKNEEINKNYKPHVFYFDQIREQKSINYPAYKWYEAYLNHTEDFAYNRYSKELAQKITDEVLGAQNKNLEEIIWKIDSKEIKQAFSKFNWPSLNRSTDIMSKQVIDNVSNNFIEVFNKWSISKFRTNVHNAWRYNEWTSVVNVDLIPYFVSVLDLVSSKVIKSANTDLEKQIDNLVEKSLSRKIAIPKKITTNNYHTYPSWKNLETQSSINCSNEYINILHWKQAQKIKSAKDCSIYRWSSYNSWTLVEANRWLNIDLIEADVELCSWRDPKWYYGWASPLNFNESQLWKAIFELNQYDTNLSIRDTFDILWSKRSADKSRNPSPLDCLKNNFLTSVERTYNNNSGDPKCVVNYALPINWTGAAGEWNCWAYNKRANFSMDFVSDYKNALPWAWISLWSCSWNTIRYENGNIFHIKYVSSWDWEWWANSCTPQVYKTNSYHFIPSYIQHKSPSYEEINEQIVSKITPNLPIDRDRYIDFISSLGNYKKINYPYLFRISWENEKEIKLKLDKYLKEKSDEINSIIVSEDPSSLSWKDLEIYNILKSGPYNSNKIDLLSFLKDKPIKEIKIDGEIKRVSYYDFLVFSMFWNNLNNISAKYKFIFENYLSDETSRWNFDYILSKNKKIYEIAYLWAQGDSQSMYVKIDAKDKLEWPYTKIFTKNKLLSSAKTSIWAMNTNVKVWSNESLFRCAPPEWVPIWEWFPAVACWISGLLPPEISIWWWRCWSSEIFESQDEYFELLKEKKVCKNDSNKNWINDCSETKIKNNARLKLFSDTSRYFFKKRWILKTQIIDETWKKIIINDKSYVSFSIKKIVDKSTNKIVYDSSKNDQTYKSEIINKYINFNPLTVPSKYWLSSYSFSSKDKEADVYFQAKLEMKDYKNKSFANIISNELIVKIRNERLFLEHSKIDEFWKIDLSKNVKANDKTNIYLIDSKNYSLDINSVNKNSLVFFVSNFWDNNTKRNINFPIEITLKNSKWKTISQEKLNNLSWLKKLYHLKKSWDYSIWIKDRYWYLAKSSFTVLPREAQDLRINLWTSVLEKNAWVSTNVVSVYDKFSNIVSSEIYDFDFNILWDSLVFEENDWKNLKQNTFEWFKAFRLKATDKPWNSRLRVYLIKDGKKILTNFWDIRVVDDIKIKTNFSEPLKVWNNKYSLNLEILDKNSKLISDLNSRIYMSVDDNYIELEEAYTKIVNWKAKINFYTKTKSKKNLNFRFRIEWFEKILDSYATIFPAEAMNIELIADKHKLKADPNTQSYIKVELRDIYNNLVFVDNNSVITLEILDEFKDIIWTHVYKQTLKNWVSNFKINATKLPWVAYLKFSIDTKLEKNNFIVWKWENIIKVSWVSENALRLETFFHYSKDSIENNKFNALYTTLLWSSYWDITQKDYLAWAMLFDKNNRSLAVTSLLNNPYNIKYILSIWSDGVLNKSYNQSDLSQDLSVKLSKDNKNRYYLDLFNKALNIHIWKIYLNLENLKITKDMYEKISNSSLINLKTLFNIYKFDITQANNQLKLNNLLKTKKNSLIIYLETDSYKVSNLSLWNSSVSKWIYYKDPFSSQSSLNIFARENLYNYDNFAKSDSLGWSSWNKTLLAFSSWNNVWESTKDYMWVNTINLWDPVLFLKKIKQKSHGVVKKFDKTIWKKLNKNEIKWYKVFDYNADSRKDILLLENSWFFALLENKDIRSWFLDQKNLARVVDIWNSDLVNTGDFSWDKYEDIFFVNTKWEPFILDNNKKDFERIDLTKNFALKWAITDAKSFDMNNDGIADIITLDSFWEVNIFYGKAWQVEFDKNTIYSGYGIKLSQKTRNDMWAIYFNWISQEVNKKIKSWDSAKDMVPTDLLENLMFEKISYDPEIDPTKENYNKNTSFVKSEFASWYWISIEKTFVDKNAWKLQSWDIVEVNVVIKNNNSSKVLKDIVYLEDIPKFFDIDMSSLKTNENIIVRSWVWKYKFMIDKFNLKPKNQIKLTYNLRTKNLKASYIKAWLFEKDEAWDDEFWDIIVSNSKYNCGWDSDIFRSTWSKSYEKGIKYEKCDQSVLPEELAKNDIDKDNNWIPDYIDELKKASQNDQISDSNIETLKNYSKNALKNHNASALKNYKQSSHKSWESLLDSLDDINTNVDKLSWEIDNLIQWFGCWFWWWSCFGFPINWAPLAPWNDPVVLWKLVWDWLKVDEWLPVFSALTWLQMSCWPSPCCIPVVWPVSSKTFIPWPICWWKWAWGSIWANSPTNFFRLYATPTLTWWAWIAACFWAPASAVWSIPPKWINPVVPGWNCVVAAAALPNFCKDEEINSDPASLWQVEYFWVWNSWFGVINWNCSVWSSWHKKLPITNKIDSNLAKNYINYRKTWVASNSLKDSFANAFKNPAKPWVWWWDNFIAQPLLSVNDWSWDESDVSVNFSLSDGIEFRWVEELTQDRVAWFPSFITQWVNDQLEEFITKLTDFPTLFVILPDFSSIQNADWEKYFKNLESWVSDAYNSWASKNNNLSWVKSVDKFVWWIEKRSSWIKEAYEFLWNVPFVSVESSPVNINIPWIDKTTLDATKANRLWAIEWYKKEIENAKDRWSYWLSCEEKQWSAKQECLENNAAWQRAILYVNKFVRSLETNLRVLEEYKNIPEKLSKLANKKQDYLEQILCNVDSVQEITVWWLDKNGKRFKAWVELYVLIKAILKSWQLLADIFIEYDAECHECKNERNDSLGSQFEIISMITPKIPVIKFPKWPDVVLDLHKIRFNLNIRLPEFNFNKRPIVLPPAPSLTLPDSPWAWLSLPALPILPSMEIPGLPDLPWLPTIKLPDLPPPPKLPKLFSSIEWFLNILKLITKAMCIIKKSPFVPESRAWDQIAFLTEWSGYRSFDFINLTMPQFSYPFVDEIQVKTFVNLEFEAEFLVEMAKTIAQPINEAGNNFSRMFDISIDDLDLSNSVNNQDINIDLNNKTSLINSNKFLSLVNKQLTSENILKNPRLKQLSKSFDIVNNYTYSKENKIIKDLKTKNIEKFDVLKSIIKKEIRKSNKIKKDLKQIQNNSFYKTISNNKINNSKIYNSALKKYNESFRKSAIALVNPKYIDNTSLKQEGQYILKDFKNSTKHIYEDDKYVYKKSKNKLSYQETPKPYFASLTWKSNTQNNTCSSKGSKYQRKYEWIYVLQKKGNTNISYKLFDYSWDLDWNEITTAIDFDLDSDIDLLYSMENNLYFKKNLINSKTKKKYHTNVISLKPSSNKFLSDDLFYESPNNAYESLVSDKFINIWFSALRKNNISNYRLEYYDRIDKYLNEDNIAYVPKNIKNNIVDSFSSIDDKSIYDSSWDIIKRKNLAYIYGLWNNISRIKLKTKKLSNIKDAIKALNVANISIWTKIYSWNSSVKISYLEDWNNETKSLKIDSNTNVEFNKSIKIIWISWDAYIFTNNDLILKWNEIYKYLGKPLSFGSKLEIYDDFNTSVSSYVSIMYYDSSEALIDFRKTKSYTIYDLWLESGNYSINLPVINDYFYSRLSAFKNNLFSTKTSQVLLSPQIYSDKYAPELDLNSKIRIPVYIEKILDLTDNIYENSWINSVEKITIQWIDENKYEILKTNNKIRIKFKSFDTIFTKKIKFLLTDKNWNTSSKDVDFEVYTPTPQINNYSKGLISWFINEDLTWEPINIYRYRWGVIKRLENYSWDTKVKTNAWNFDFKLNTVSSNLVDIKINDSLAFNVLEDTWKIILNNPLFKIITTIRDDNFVEFIVLDASSKKVFSQILKLKADKNNIYVTDSFDDLSDKWIYLKLLWDKFDYYKIPNAVRHNPWTIVVYRKSDLNKLPLFAITRQWRIKVLNSNFYKIQYSSYDDYVVLKLIDKHFNKTIWELLFKIDSSYIIK